jgi:antitoxin CcdA
MKLDVADARAYVVRMSTRSSSTPSRRRAVNLSVDPTLVPDARELGIPLSQAFEEALRVRIAQARRSRWREENRLAIDEYNARIERSGVFSDGLRRF